MFRLSYNTNGLMNLPLERAIEEVAKAGYEGREESIITRFRGKVTLIFLLCYNYSEKRTMSTI